jgi:hypothetical protein
MGRTEGKYGREQERLQIALKAHLSANQGYYDEGVVLSIMLFVSHFVQIVCFTPEAYFSI